MTFSILTDSQIEKITLQMSETLDDHMKATLDIISNLKVTPLLCTEVEDLSEGAKSSKASFVISPSRFILIYPPKYELRSWKKLISLQYERPIITIHFSNSVYVFRSDIPDELMGNICHFIQRILLPTELRQIHFDKLNAPPYCPGTFSFAARYMLNETNSFSKNYERLLQIISGFKPTPELEKFDDLDNFLPIFADILPFIQMFKYIRFPRIDSYNIMNILADLPLNLRSLYMIELVGKIHDGFDRFLSCIKANKDYSKLNTLSFENSHLEVHQLLLLSEAILNGAIKGVEFHRAIHPTVVPYFYSHFLRHDICRSLYLLNLDRTPDIDLKLLFTKVKNIPFVSLAYCDLDIGDVFKAIFEAEISNISVLNLTGNNASTVPQIPNGVTVPVTLRKLILDNISWPVGYFTPHLLFLFNYFEYGVSLSLSNIVTSDNDWNQLFDFLSTCEYNKLLGLSWKGNPINLEFMKFLHRNPYIYTLNIDSCLRSTHKDIIAELSALIRDSKRLTHLSASGTRYFYVGPLILDVFDACVGHPTLQTINIPCQIAGYGMIQMVMLTVVAESPLKIFNFEGFCPNNAKNLSKLLKEIAKYKNRIKISFPTLDVLRCVKFKKMTNDEHNQLRELFLIDYDDPDYDRIRKNGKFDIEQSSQTFLNNPAIVYKYYPEDPFPLYYDEERIKDLKNELIYLPLHTHELFPRNNLHTK